MTDKRVKVPEERIKRISQELGWPIPYTETACEAIYGDLVDHPIVPTDEQIVKLSRNCPPSLRGPEQLRWLFEEFQRRFMFNEPEPEDPLADLIEKHFGTNPADWVKDLARESFERGQQSMIRKDG